MRLQNFYYLNTIIENDYNLSTAADLLHISQPALSHMISKLEENENILIFNRQKNRLTGLTPAGEIFYDYSKQICSIFEEMNEKIQEESNSIQENISLGLPPIIISFFNEILPKMIIENSNITFTTIEYGAEKLKELFLNDEISIVALLDKNGLNLEKVETEIIHKDEICAFVGKNHPLSEKAILSWNDLKTAKIAMLDENHMVNTIVYQRLKMRNIKPAVPYHSSSIELLLNSTRNSPLVTLLPRPVADLYNMDGIKMLKFNQKLEWNVVLCRKRRTTYSPVEDFIYKYLVNSFQQKN